MTFIPIIDTQYRTMTSKSKAIVQRGAELLLEDISLPELQANQVRVHVENAAFNPTDRLSLWSSRGSRLTLNRSRIRSPSLWGRRSTWL